ncbi:uncharacterized protein LOC129568837 isoform X1 [Sitodiplosis mosellana]|uniref:uncharacterized protein LOC129568837 isoform X1 n=1 Tax=Sitodiplosis mosellana TaxID=263140 RepID=UPI0024437BFC|nr:uncharacterized protein LOC129568837 isoform X1 [Sitodiplosis mosellana]XP_055303131.1 uncharacterized protein LOC129568837 isoform X1 [Sitodiplosis mosellana]
MSASKKRKLVDEEDQHQSGPSTVEHNIGEKQVAIVSPTEGCSSEESRPDILTIHCFDEIFEYLSLKDLHSIGRTCKTMQQVAGQYFKQNYSSTKIGCNQNGIYTDLRTQNPVQFLISTFHPIKLFGFEPFISSMYIHPFVSPLTYFKLPCNDEQITSVNKININSIVINYHTAKLLQRILPRVETIQIQNSKIYDLYEFLLKYCGGLKRLYIKKSNFDHDYYDKFGQQKWLMQHYRQLEHFEYHPPDSLFLNELNTFLERNEKIHTFATSLECLWKNRHAFINSEAKLNILEVKCCQEFGSDEPTLQSLCNLVNQLHEKGFHRRFHLYVQRVDEEFNTQAVSLNGLEKLCIKGFHGTLPPLAGLKELAILDYSKDSNEPSDNRMETIANDLLDLQRLYLNNANSIDDVMPFIRRSLKLNKLKIFFKRDSYPIQSSFRKQIFPLSKLNREREKLFEARKVTIYVSEKSFVDTKWATRNGDINLRLIEMKRAESYEWNQYFTSKIE